MICYIAGAYTAPTREGIQANIDAAEAAGKEMLLHHGFVPLIPHKITSHWDSDPIFADWPHKDWLDKFCIPLLDKADVIIMLPGWQESPGSVREHQHASNTGKPIFYYGG